MPGKVLGGCTISAGFAIVGAAPVFSAGDGSSVGTGLTLIRGGSRITGPVARDKGGVPVGAWIGVAGDTGAEARSSASGVGLTEGGFASTTGTGRGAGDRRVVACNEGGASGCGSGLRTALERRTVVVFLNDGLIREAAGTAASWTVIGRIGKGGGLAAPFFTEKGGGTAPVP